MDSSTVTRRWDLLRKALPWIAGILLSAAPVLSSSDENFGSVGLQVVPVATGELVVLGVVPDSPADRVGLRAGDFIFAVDGERLQGREFAEVVQQYLWGPPGTEVGLSFLRPGVEGVHKVVLKRIPMEVKPSSPRNSLQ